MYSEMNSMKMEKIIVINKFIMCVIIIIIIIFNYAVSASNHTPCSVGRQKEVLQKVV